MNNKNIIFTWTRYLLENINTKLQIIKKNPLMNQNDIPETKISFTGIENSAGTTGHIISTHKSPQK